ncbi:MAG: heavy-metal-associated domain-containing protein [Candidatus Marinimicrobia bacterium]|nr:heavy-metal-associated domain-containing protein [Candidatus Neomarinimicrobiota bacterium]MBL7010908.1 heavy-metal-associated domain-containing protein [Candidatus Neomarinimicrobiota bacterium]MBL7031344.1 heavy-metal-associated domain-containing protein [Candidatus Neomarinimicrobiota bacterium]
MKSIIKTGISVIVAGLLISCSSDTKTAELKLASIQCGMCTSNVETAVADLEGVSKVEVDLDNKIGKVTYKASIIDLAAIEKAIAAVGYDANNTKADPEVYADLAMCCKLPEDQ